MAICSFKMLTTLQMCRYLVNVLVVVGGSVENQATLRFDLFVGVPSASMSFNGRFLRALRFTTPQELLNTPWPSRRGCLRAVIFDIFARMLAKRPVVEPFFEASWRRRCWLVSGTDWSIFVLCVFGESAFSPVCSQNWVNS